MPQNLDMYCFVELGIWIVKDKLKFFEFCYLCKKISKNTITVMMTYFSIKIQRDVNIKCWVQYYILIFMLRIYAETLEKYLKFVFPDTRCQSYNIKEKLY